MTQGLVSEYSYIGMSPGDRLANVPSVGHCFYEAVMARLMLCISLARMLAPSPLLSVPTVETCSLCFKKEKIKEYGVITTPVLLNVHDVRSESVSLRAWAHLQRSARVLLEGSGRWEVLYDDLGARDLGAPGLWGCAPPLFTLLLSLWWEAGLPLECLVMSSWCFSG